jgi:hypothetical protein
MATIQQQISLSERRRQRALASQPQTPSYVPQVYDETTTEGQVLSTRQQISQARTPLQQFKSQYLFPKKRERAFTDRRARSQIVQAGQGVAEQLGQIQQQEQTFEREVATKAPEYALQAQKQQALMEAKQSIQRRVDSLQEQINTKLARIEGYKQDRREARRPEDRRRLDEYIDRAEDDISEYKAELNEYQKGLGLGEDNLIKQHFSGYIQEKALYERDYREARNKQQEDFRKMKQQPDFQKTLDDLKKSGISIGNNPTLTQFSQAVNKFNSDIAYKNQLLKFAEQKGGVQFLNKDQQKALGFDSQGFDYYKTPQKVWVDPRTGQVVEQSFINDNIPKNLGYRQYDASAFNKQTGKYLLEGVSDSLLTDQQQRMYETFQKNPRAAGLFGYKIDQSAILPTSFVIGGTSQGVPQPQPSDPFRSIFNPKGNMSAYDVASRMQPFTTAEIRQMEALKMQGMKQPEPTMTYTIKYGSFYKNFDARLGGILPGGVTRQQVQSAKRVAEGLLNANVPIGTTKGIVVNEAAGPSFSYVISITKKKDGIGVSVNQSQGLNNTIGLGMNGSLDINELSNLRINNSTNNISLSNLSTTQKESAVRGLAKVEWLRSGYTQEQIASSESGFNKFFDRVLDRLNIRPSEVSRKQRQELRNELQSDKFRQEALKGLGDKDVRAFYRSVQYGSAILPSVGIPMSIASGLLLDTTAEKIPTFKELGISTAMNTASAYLTNRLVGIGGKGSLLRQGIKITGFFGSEQLTRTTGIVDYLVPQKSTGFALSGAPRQVARGGIFTLIASNPLMATAYASQFLKTATRDPYGTAKSAKQYILENPYEVLTPTAWRYRKAIRTPIDYMTGSRMPKIITTEKFPRIPRDITTAYLKKGGLIKGFKGYLRSPLKWDILTGSPVKESIGTKVLLSELRAIYKGKYYKINVKNGVQTIKIKGVVTPISKLKNIKITSSGGQKIAYGTPQIGKKTFAMGEVFAESVKRNPTYWRNWISHAYKYGLRNTIKKYGLPKPKNSNIMLNEGDYYPRKSGESANAYYKRIQSIADKSGRVIVADAPKTVARTTQPEFEVVYLYPKDAMGNAIVSRVKIGTDSFGRSIYREFPRKISLIERIGTKLEAKKVNYLSYIEGIKKAVAKDTSQFMSRKYSNIYKDTLKWFEGKWDKSDRSHFTNVERNLREIVKKYNLPYSNDLIRAFARIHDILKLRGLNITDEAIVKKAVKSGALDSILDIKKLSYADKMLLADAIGFHHIANPNLYYNIRLRDFIKAAINADRLDITRYGAKVDTSRLFRIGKKDLLSAEQDILSKNKRYWNSLTNKQRNAILERESYASEYDYVPTNTEINGYIVGNSNKYEYQRQVVSKEQSYRYNKPTVTGYKNYLVGTPSRSYPKTSYKKQQISYPNYLISRPSARYTPTYKRTPQVTTRYEPSKKTYQPPLVPQRTYRPPYQPPRQQPIQPLQKTLIIRQQPRKKEQPERQLIRKPQRYNILPTITQQIYRVRRKGGKLKRSRGFELLRV